MSELVKGPESGLRCDHCHFWERSTYIRPMGLEPQPHPTEGKCVRFPPCMSGGRFDSAAHHPRTKSADYCGEFSDRGSQHEL